MSEMENTMVTPMEYDDPPMLIRTMESGGFLRANNSFLKAVHFIEADLAGKPFLDWIVPEDHSSIQALLDGKEESCEVGHITRMAEPFILSIKLSDQGQEPMILGRCADEVRKGKESVEPEEEDSVKKTLETIALIVEEQNPSFLCSILLVKDGRLVSGGGPSLLDEYSDAINGYAIGPAVGSCGTAVYWNVPVIVEDIQADPLWSPFAELAKKAGVAACWSHPFTSSSGRVLGALAFYSRNPRQPTPRHLVQLKSAARIAGFAVESAYPEEALIEQQKSELELESC